MDQDYARFGMATAMRRFEAETGASAATEFERRMRQLESGAGEFNLSPAAVHLASEIAALEPGLDDGQRLALILLVTASLVALEEGSTRLPAAAGPGAFEPMRRTLSVLCGDAFGPAGAEAMAQKIGELLASGAAPVVIARTPDDYKPLVYIAPFIYHQRLRAAEVRLAGRLRARLEAEPTASRAKIETALADVLARPSRFEGGAPALFPEQRDAVAKAAGRRLAVISGGPGTGKTSIIVAILRLLVRLGINPGEIALAAPTGKAAFRMGESVRRGLDLVSRPAEADNALLAACPEPSTVHRLLAYSPGRRTFLRHENNPLAASVVIVDETSMLDLLLMERLLGAVRPDAHLVMLGDADQLPSVAAGAVFRDLVPTASADGGAAEDPRVDACARLTHNHRMDSSNEGGRAVLSLASAINRGQTHGDGGADALAPLERRKRPGDLRFAGVEFLSSTAAGLGDFLEYWYDAHLRAAAEDARQAVFVEGREGFEPAACERLGRLFAQLGAARILCVTRVLAAGADRVNALLHQRAAEAAADGASGASQFLPGEPVMAVRNDYERMLFNGDQGIVLRVRRPPRRAAPMAVFARGNGFAAFYLAALGESLERCYATTVHKAQGSEFDSVAVVMPEQDVPILTREVLYTAVSRARRSVVLFGDEELVKRGIRRGSERCSGLSELLAGGRGA